MRSAPYSVDSLLSDLSCFFVSLHFIFDSSLKGDGFFAGCASASGRLGGKVMEMASSEMNEITMLVSVATGRPSWR
jgi:hypothetical protein